MPAISTLLWLAGALVLGVVMLRFGVTMLRALGTPLPPPPPSGEMRRVNLRYRCSICGIELRITAANEELPEPPRHCQDEMDLVAPVE